MTFFKTITSAKIKDGFRHQRLTKIQGEPTFEGLTAMAQELTRIAATVKSSLGGGRHGLSGLVEPTETYFLETNHHFNRMADPGELPPYGLEADQNRRQETSENFELDTILCETCNNTEESLKSQIEECIKPQCHGEMWENVHCFGTRTIQDIITYLMSQHGNVSPDAKMSIFPNMIKPMDPHTPVASIFKQIEDGVKFGIKAGSPITASQQLMAAETLILKMGGKFNHAYWKWKEEDRPLRDYLTFKTHVTKDAKLKTQMASTSAQAGHHGASVAEVTDAYAEMASVANQFATSQAARDSAMETMANTNRDLQLQLANVTLNMNQAQVGQTQRR